MTGTSATQSQKRFSESLGALFEASTKKSKVLFLKSSSDVGVMRNGGRNGARYAPRSLMSVLKKFNQNAGTSRHALVEVEVSSYEDEVQDFAQAQIREAERIRAHLSEHAAPIVCHLGGGHDHIYPLLKAIAPGYKKVIVLNIDAHADTRTDGHAHSGTPFRQFALEYEGEFHLFQVGLHAFSNSLSTLTELEKGKMHVLWREEIKEKAKLDHFFEQIKTLSQEALVVFSLDADALDGSEVPGVSAVNPYGVTLHELMDLWRRYKSINASTTVLGIYELNPVFDGLSMMSMKKMSTLIFEVLKYTDRS